MVQYAAERGILKSLSVQPSSPNDSLLPSPRYIFFFNFEIRNMTIVNLLSLLIAQVLYFDYILTEFLMNVAIHIFDQIHHLTQDQAICKYQSIIFMLIKVIFHIRY